MASSRSFVGDLKTFLGRPLVRNYGHFAGCVLLSLILLLVDGRFVWPRIMAIRADREAAQQTLSALVEKVAKLRDFTGEWEAEELDTQFDRFDQAVPSESDVPALLTQVQSIAYQNGVDITALQFGGEGSGTGDAQAQKEVRLNFSSTSSFDNLLQLLKAFEVTSRLIDVESVQYTASSETSDVSAQLILVSYYIPEPTPQITDPITFSYGDADFVRNSMILVRLSPYETEEAGQSE